MLEFKYIFGENGYKIAKDIREKIFAEEMRFTETSDELDEKSYHFVGYDKIRQISAARLTQTGERTYAVSFVGIDRDYRRQFVGDLIMRALADKTVTLGGTAITVETPPEVRGFFEYEGYEAVGAEYTAYGVRLIKMVKDLTKVETHCRGCKE